MTDEVLLHRVLELTDAAGRAEDLCLAAIGLASRGGPASDCAVLARALRDTRPALAGLKGAAAALAEMWLDGSGAREAEPSAVREQGEPVPGPGRLALVR